MRSTETIKEKSFSILNIIRNYLTKCFNKCHDEYYTYVPGEGVVLYTYLPSEYDDNENDNE